MILNGCNGNIAACVCLFVDVAGCACTRRPLLHACRVSIIITFAFPLPVGLFYFRQLEAPFQSGSRETKLSLLTSSRAAPPTCHIPVVLDACSPAQSTLSHVNVEGNARLSDRMPISAQNLGTEAVWIRTFDQMLPRCRSGSLKAFGELLMTMIVEMQSDQTQWLRY